VLPANRQRIEAGLDDGAVVLEIGGWADPFPRADWVIDLMPYESRGLYSRSGGGTDAAEERFSAERWIVRDACSSEPYPFEDDYFDFVVCSHTLEDLRDPVRVCSEMNRIARAGYIEVPSRLEEQCPGVNGPWIGWSHHRWLVDIGERSISFVHKPALLHGKLELQVPPTYHRSLPPDRRVCWLFWEGGFDYGERIFHQPEELDWYLGEIVPEHRLSAWTDRRSGWVSRLLRRAGGSAARDGSARGDG
jgi:SAM-dependent methyltransferase